MPDGIGHYPRRPAEGAFWPCRPAGANFDGAGISVLQYAQMLTIKLKVTAGAVLATAVLLAGCSAATSKGGIPQVAGNYSGKMTVSAPTLLASQVEFPMRMAVEQSGTRVTASGTLTIQGSESTFVWVGTIDETGLFTPDEAQAPGALDTSLCGAVQVVTNRLAFTGNRAVLALIMNTAACGLIDYSASLAR